MVRIGGYKEKRASVAAMCVPIALFVPVLLTLVGLMSCSGDSSSSRNDCPVGAERCPCTSGHACDPGLVCLSDVCVAFDAGASGGGGTTTEGGTATGGNSMSGSTGSRWNGRRRYRREHRRNELRWCRRGRWRDVHGLYEGRRSLRARRLGLAYGGDPSALSEPSIHGHRAGARERELRRRLLPHWCHR